MTKRILGVFLVVWLSYSVTAAQSAITQKDTSFVKPLRIVPSFFYTQHLSFFCKKEIQLQKLTKTNLFIRLGTKDWVDYLERKPNTVNQ